MGALLSLFTLTCHFIFDATVTVSRFSVVILLYPVRIIWWPFGALLSALVWPLRTIWTFSISISSDLEVRCPYPAQAILSHSLGLPSTSFHLEQILHQHTYPNDGSFYDCYASGSAKTTSFCLNEHTGLDCLGRSTPYSPTTSQARLTRSTGRILGLPRTHSRCRQRFHRRAPDSRVWNLRSKQLRPRSIRGQAHRR